MVSMNDVVVFRNIEKPIALMPGVQAALAAKATEGFAAAAAVHAAYPRRQRRKGDPGSRVRLAHGKIDWHIVLDDERSKWAAWQVDAHVQVLAAAAHAMGA